MRVALGLALALAVFVGTWPEAAHAYFGPGAGITMLGALWGVILAVAFAIFAFLAWPIRALLRKRKKASEAPAATTTRPRDATR